MIFKLTSLTITFVLVSSIFSGCTNFLRNEPVQKTVIEIKSEDTACLNGLTSKLKKMVTSNVTDHEIDANFKCIDQVLNQFQSRVDGKENSNSYTSSELQTVLNKFYKSSDLSKQAIEDLLVLKTALFGGPEELITKVEISDLRAFLKVLNAELKKLSSHMLLFSFEKQSQHFSKDKIDLGFSQLKSSLKVLLDSTKIRKSEYGLPELKKLLKHFLVFDSDKEELFKLAEDIKILLVGPQSLQTKHDFELAIDNFSELMTLASYVVNQDVSFEIKSKDQLSKVTNFLDRSLALLADSVQFQKQGKILVSSIDPLIESLINKDILPFKVKVDTFKSFYKKIIIKIFSDQRDVSVDGFESIRWSHLNFLRKELEIFKLNMDYINSIQFQSNMDRKNIKILQTQFLSYKPSFNFMHGAKFNTEDQAYILNGFQDLKNEFISSRPVTYRFKKMVIAANQEIWDTSWEDLTRALYGKMLARELIRGWGESDAVTESGLVQWYEDFKLFAIEIKSFDPRSLSLATGKETFLQANLFTAAGNGDQKLDKMETFQYVNMLLSGGGQAFDEVRLGLAAAGCNLSENDVFGYPWNDENCFYKDFKKNYRYYYSNLSYFVGYLDKLSDSEFKDYYDGLMLVARTYPENTGRVESSDIRVLNMTLIYIESLFSAYDSNKNWMLSASEIRSAFPKFESFIVDYAQKNAKADLESWDVAINPCRALYPLNSFIKEAFVFLAYNGRLPNKSDVNDPSSVSNIYECGKYHLGFESKYEPFTFKGEINRKTIINTFKVLRTALESN